MPRLEACLQARRLLYFHLYNAIMFMSTPHAFLSIENQPTLLTPSIHDLYDWNAHRVAAISCPSGQMYAAFTGFVSRRQ